MMNTIRHVREEGATERACCWDSYRQPANDATQNCTGPPAAAGERRDDRKVVGNDKAKCTPVFEPARAKTRIY